MSTRKLTVDDFNRAAVRVYELDHHREPDTGALHVPALRSLALVEGLEDAAALLERNARSRYQPTSRTSWSRSVCA